MAPRILITGASGFIGRHLSGGLKGNWEQVHPTSLELNLLDAEAVRRYLEKGHFDQILHAATWNATPVASRNPALAFEQNLRMFFNLARCRGTFGRLIHFGSGAEFDRQHWHSRMAEDELGQHIPRDDYGLSKFIIAQQSETFPWALNLRLFGVFGPHEDARIRFISTNACRGLRGEPLSIRQDRNFDYLHVDDVVTAVAHILGQPNLSGSINLCRGEGHRLSDITAMIIDAIGTPLPVEIESPGQDREYSGANNKLLALLPGWHPSPLEAGVLRQVRWLQEHRTHLIVQEGCSP